MKLLLILSGIMFTSHAIDIDYEMELSGIKKKFFGGKNDF